MTGVINPSSMATAIPTSTFLCCRTWSPWKVRFIFGERRSATAAALITMSLTETLDSSAFASSRIFSAASISTSTVR
jgi:hypothetical protein